MLANIKWPWPMAHCHQDHLCVCRITHFSHEKLPIGTIAFVAQYHRRFCLLYAGACPNAWAQGRWLVSWLMVATCRKCLYEYHQLITYQ